MSRDDKRDAFDVTFLAPATTLILLGFLLDVLRDPLDDVVGGGDQLNVDFGPGSLDGPVSVAAAAVEQRQIIVPLVLRLPSHAAHRDEDGGQQPQRRGW